ncbi:MULTISPECIES: DNA ligase D [unclassified Pseudomonas]|uniref:DNA ligase D n=1 Tax=unclassified Pseudomonas TaxID=196821 RepID=UPI0009D80743|nr:MULTISPECIES: DNA ligase D [Pseudomonas]SMC91904.1 ATP-dependent DNA ligase LigD phosphoesterase module/ATP-dependent DNA ligase LigD polymerase module [Pseudomonas sp. URIL14HWK12:I5]SNS87836.1 bifunctional non-homologous end joining protein LigD [Pseudomonas sp. LAMO17WK12:I8]SNY18714.1 bifunctional non-homologous end joining protein LigD [Pseudomonas sp. LAMO17WK12:I12]SNY18893.1 bifunctional non-homologous end joining protein LigD [Pseudomonas sp. LAMO17WK12:I11]SNY18913.1 bifunctional 
MAKPLQEYQRKRDFNATPEPAGKRARPRSAHALQYCIQKHDASHLHYDFRLELDGTLKSWAIPKGPSLDPKVRRLAVHVEDHPLDYANFEGRIPEGHYGAGDVIVWDRGVWEPEGDPREAYAKGKLRFRLQGEKLSGVWNLFRTHLAGKKEQWMLVKSHDGQARSETDYRIVEALPDSVLSERTLPPRSPGKATTVRHKRKTDPKALPDALQPQLATLVASPPSGDWRYEVKFDGYRILARIDGDDIRLFTRNGHDWSAKMPRQVEALKALGLDSAWLDGEMVVVDDNGVADFQALQNAFDTEHDERITYYLFDLPWLGGEDLRALPLQQRRATLARLLEGHASQVIRYSADFKEPVASLLDSACRLELEGLIGKRADSPYVGRRSSDWVKLKCKQRQEFVIVGYTDPKGSRNGFGALLLALHDHGSGPLRYAGKVGTGFSAATLDSIHARLKPLQTDKSPLPKPPTGAEARGVHWLKPQLLAEVAYAQMTREGIVRHSVFHGLRDDKPATAIDLERAMPTKRAVQTEPENLGTLRLTHPDRVVDATTGATKREVAQYYAQVADWLLPQLKDRPVALVRAPDGLDGELFFQKNAGQLNIPNVLSYNKAQAGQAAMVLNRADSLMGAVQMNTLELHTWNATTKDFDKPDRFVLDLDPDPALPWKAMLEATQLTLTLLDELGLKVFLKTSGGKGMHLVVPLTRRAGWDEVKDFSHALVNHMAGLFPDRLSAVSGPKNRVGRIFIDYLRNGKGATTAAAYSLRAREGLPVSVPIWREELNQLKGANQWNIGNLHTRLSQVEDPWAEMGKTRQSITLRMRKQLGIA